MELYRIYDVYIYTLYIQTVDFSVLLLPAVVVVVAVVVAVAVAVAVAAHQQLLKGP